MKCQRLSPLSLSARPRPIRPSDGRYPTPSLYLVVHRSGRKSFAVRTRSAGKPLKVTLKTLDLAAARAEAARLVEHARHGRDPRVERARQEAETVRAVCELWLAKDQADNRTYATVKRGMERDVLPFSGNMPITAVRKRDVITVIDRIAERSPAHANLILAYMKRFFTWAAHRDLIDASPGQYVERPAPIRSRDRVLTEAELKTIWRLLRATTITTISSAFSRSRGSAGRKSAECGGAS
jgi:hypothetical protein